jgi:hypothetical protein
VTVSANRIKMLRAIAKIAGDGPIVGMGLEYRRAFDPVVLRAKKMFGVDDLSLLTKGQVSAMIESYRSGFLKEWVVMPTPQDPAAPKPSRAMMEAMYLSGRVVGKTTAEVKADVV